MQNLVWALGSEVEADATTKVIAGVLGAIFVVVAVVVWISSERDKAKRLQALKQRLVDLGLTTPAIEGGRYVSGHPEIVVPSAIFIGHRGDEFLLIGGDAKKAATIPASAIKAVRLLDRTQLVALRSVYRALILSHSVLAVDWSRNKMEISTMITFPTPILANKAASLFMHHGGVSEAI